MTSSVQSSVVDEKLENQIDKVDAWESSSGDNVYSRDVWSKTVNESAEVAGVAVPVAAGIVIGGGADSWPSLSEGANTRIKPSYRTVPESSLSLTSHASSSKNSAGDFSSRNNSVHNGSRSGSNRQPKSNVNRSSSGNGARSYQQHHRPSFQGPVSDVSSNNSSHNGNSQLESDHNNGPRPHGGGNHTQQRDSNRRGNGGPPRGDVFHGRRRNVDRDSNPLPSNFSGRNSPVLPPVFPGPFPVPIPRPALPVTPYAPPPPPPFPHMPFMAPGIYPFAGRPVLYGPPVPMRPHPFFVPMGPPIVIAELCNQIEYYFSDENLVRDVYLRRNMDEQGWVMVNTIAEFRKVKEIIAKVKPFLDNKEIDPLRFILNAMLNSSNVEVQVEACVGNKLRKRTDWRKYILPKIGDSSSTARGSPANAELAVRLENTTLEKPNINDSRTEARDNVKDDHDGQQASNLHNLEPAVEDRVQ